MFNRATTSARLCGAALLMVLGAQAYAQTSGEGLNEIVVTARRVEERLQDVPISITVFNQQQLNERNITNVSDLASYTPSLSANTTFGSDNTTFAIRGFTQDVRTTPSVGIYFADVVSPRGTGSVSVGDGAGPGDFFDLQNVQVLKGPQGTLFGRNTTGGDILLVPEKPTAKEEGFAEVSYGNYDMKRFQGVFNLPLTDWAGSRFGIDREARDGYITNTSGIGPARFDDVNYLALRASLVVDVTPNIENYAIASYTTSRTNGDLQKLEDCNPSPVPANFLGQLACAQLAAGKSAGFFSAQNEISDPTSDLTQWRVIDTTTWRATDTLTVKDILSYAQLHEIKRSDLFGTDLQLAPGLHLNFSDFLPGPGETSADQSTFTEELQLQGHALGDRLDYQMGGYLEISDPIGTLGSLSPQVITCPNTFSLQCTDYLGLASGSLVGSVDSVTDGGISYRDIGVYAQSSYSLTDQLKLTAGLRYTDDRSIGKVENVTYYFPAPNTPLGFCVSSLVYTPGLPITAPGDCYQRFEQTSHAPTWLVDLDYKPIDDLLLYAKYARGYRQGSVNPVAADGFQTFKPEKVDSYEVGSKLSFASAIHGTLDFAGFYNKFSQQQLAVIFSGPDVAEIPGIVNAGSSRIYGAELEASITPFKGFTLYGDYSYLDSKLQSITVPPLAAGTEYTVVSLSTKVGDTLPLTPTNKISFTGDYTLPLPDTVGRVVLGATYTYTGKEFVNTSSPYGYIQPMELINLNLQWSNLMRTPVDVSMFVTNLANKQYFSYVAGFYNTAGFDTAQIAPPRMYGVRLKYRFGG